MYRRVNPATPGVTLLPNRLPRHLLSLSRATLFPLAHKSPSVLPVLPSGRPFVRRTLALFVRSFGRGHRTARILVARTLCSYARHPSTHLCVAGPSEHCLLSARPPDDVLLLFARPVPFSLARSLADLLLVSSDCVLWLSRTCSAWLCRSGLVRTRSCAPDLLLGLLWASDSPPLARTGRTVEYTASGECATNTG